MLEANDHWMTELGRPGFTPLPGCIERVLGVPQHIAYSSDTCAYALEGVDSTVPYAKPFVYKIVFHFTIIIKHICYRYYAKFLYFTKHDNWVVRVKETNAIAVMSVAGDPRGDAFRTIVRTKKGDLRVDAVAPVGQVYYFCFNHVFKLYFNSYDSPLLID